MNSYTFAFITIFAIIIGQVHMQDEDLESLQIVGKIITTQTAHGQILGHDVGPNIEMITEIMRRRHIHRVYLTPSNQNGIVAIMDIDGNTLDYVGGEEGHDLIAMCQHYACPISMSCNYVTNIVNDVIYIVDANQHVVDIINPEDIE